MLLTLRLEDHWQEFFEAGRCLHYPAHFNKVPAHLTLFHKLPIGVSSIQESLSTRSRRPGLPLTVSGIVHTGNGVAYTLSSPALQELHQQMQADLDSWLIPRDRALLAPHITIQNKVTHYRSKMLADQLNKGFEPFNVMGTGIISWEYLKGAWKQMDRYEFDAGR